MTKPVLGLDLDGVVVNFNAMWIPFWEEDFGEVHHVADIVEWDYRKGGVDMASPDFYEWARQRRLWMPHQVRTYGDSLAAAQSLHHQWRVHIITSRPDWAKRDTVDWLTSWSGIRFEDLTFTREKHRVVCDAYVDDSPKNLKALVAYQPTATVYRFVQPYNWTTPGTEPLTSLRALL